MVKNPEFTSGIDGDADENEIAKVWAKVGEGVHPEKARTNLDSRYEFVEHANRAIDIVNDHFPDDISPSEHFERDNEPSPFQTEEDYKQAFSCFEQEEWIPIETSKKETKFNTYTYPYRETVNLYRTKAIETVQDLTGETGKLPRTDVAIYLDKSARPVSWFVDEFWDKVTDAPKPDKYHLAIDRRTWLNYFDVELSSGEYLKNSDDLATWDNLPIHDVTQEEILQLRGLLRDGIISHEELDGCLRGDVSVKNRISGRITDALLKDEEIQERIKNNTISRMEFEELQNEALKKVKILDSRDKLKNINEARMIAERIRGLFVEGGLSEDDVKNPERIMDYPVGMEGKNITIIDEVQRSGMTGEIAKHFMSWAFPEAESVNFYVYFEAKRLSNDTPQDGQMLMIPFWYSLEHDDGLGRGIGGIDQAFYDKLYEENPNNKSRALKLGADFLGVPIVYEEEKGKKSLLFREQIARLRVEDEKGHIY